MRYWLAAEAFAAAGHKVVYWTADFNHALKKPRVFKFNPSLDVRLVHAPAYGANISLRRVWSHFRWAKAWAAAAKAEAAAGGPPSLVVASQPPILASLEAVRFAHSCGAKAIVDIMDAWPDTFVRLVPRFARCMLLPLRSQAARAICSADGVTAVSSRYCDLAASSGAKQPARLFYHGIALAPRRDEVGKHASRGIRLVYAGGLGRTYDLATVMESVLLVDGATLAIAGRGDGETELRQLANEPRFAGRVSFAGNLDAAALADFLSAADIGVIPMSPESCVGIPYKMADYAAAGLAMVGSLGGESARLAARYGAGAQYRPGDAASLAAAVDRLAKDLESAKAGARRLAECEFDASRIYPDYVKFAESVAAAGV